MRAMIPPALRRPGFPSPAVLVAFTGVCELAGAIGLVAPWQLLGLEWVRWLAGAALVVFLIAVFPANAYAAAASREVRARGLPVLAALPGAARR